MNNSAWETYIGLQLQENQFPTPVREYKFLKTRRFRFDYAWPDIQFALEVEGGVYSGGRHTTGKGFTADCEKYNLALIEGWKVMRVTSAQIRQGQALEWLTSYFNKWVK